MITLKPKIKTKMKTKIKFGAYMIGWAMAYLLLLAFIGVRNEWGNMIVGFLFTIVIILSGIYYAGVENLKTKTK